LALWDSLGGYSGMFVSWATSTAFWILVMLILVATFFVMLYIRKRRKMNKAVLEMIDLGDGRFDFILGKGGWFKTRTMFFGLWDYGSESRFRLKDMTPVDNVSHNDYRLLNGKQALVVVRNPNDPKIVFPISRFYLSKNSKSIMSDVAPADFRDSAEKAIEQADLEMQSKWQQYAPMIIIGIVIIISLIITLLNTQYGKYMVDKASEAIIQIRTTGCGSLPSSAP